MDIIFLLFLLVVTFLIRKPLVRLIKKLEIQSLNDQLDRLTNDPEYQKILKKNNIKPVDWKKNHDLSDLNSVWEKKREGREKEEKKRKKEYQTNYNKLKTIKNLKTILKVGISKEDIKGKPDHKIEKVSRGKKREELFYGGYKNRLGKFSYTFRVVIIDGKVDGWNDIKN
jgi:hypothetical protein